MTLNTFHFETHWYLHYCWHIFLTLFLVSPSLFSPCVESLMLPQQLLRLFFCPVPLLPSVGRKVSPCLCWPCGGCVTTDYQLISDFIFMVPLFRESWPRSGVTNEMRGWKGWWLDWHESIEEQFSRKEHLVSMLSKRMSYGLLRRISILHFIFRN